MKKITGFLLLLLTSFANAQTIQLLAEGTKASLRGLSVVDDNTVWVSGSNGTVGLSLDGGSHWKWMTVKGFEKADFRDIEGFDKTTAVIMGIAEPAYILRTTDAGESWQVVFENKDKGMFLDAMEFWNEQSGIVIGDPIDSAFFIARTFDGGKSWQGIPQSGRPLAATGEACFASSGTNVRKISKQEAVIVTGGLQSNVIVRDKKYRLPLMSGRESTGANSIAVKNKKIWMVVGGDFTKKDATDSTAATSCDAGKTWTLATVPPTGYRSCVAFIKKKTWITCGLNGVDITEDNGVTFRNISNGSFHAVSKAKKGKAVYLSGNGGRIGKLLY